MSTQEIASLSYALTRAMNDASAEGLAPRRTLASYGPGIHGDVPEDVYHAKNLGTVSKGSLVRLAQSPAHYKAWIDGSIEDEETTALKFGRAFHVALLEPDRFGASYAVEPDFGDCRFKENKARRDGWRSDNAGKQPVTKDEASAITGMIFAVRAHPIAGKMIRDGRAELTALWKDETTGLSCRARAD